MFAASTAQNFSRIKSRKNNDESRMTKGRKLNKTKRGGKLKYSSDWSNGS